MNYWHLQMNKGLIKSIKDFSIQHVQKILKTDGIIGTGNWNSYQCEQFKGIYWDSNKNMDVGDIVLVRSGKTGIALCEVTGNNVHYGVGSIYENQREIKLLTILPPHTEVPPHGQGTLSISINEDTETWEYIDNLYQTYLISMKNQKYITLLLQKYQIILTGAPGTGKTYLARAIAQDMVGKGKANLQTAFVQFHPSYDYTDFVEGLRPVQQGSQISFELKNGAFKEFCRVAGVVERLKFAGKDTITEPDLATFLGKDSEGYKFWNTDEYVGKKIKDVENDLPKFVFIIDEVNRAEISKVFGELMFSIDEGYRGIAGKVKTQYANIQTDATFFTDKDNDYFFVPSNVYILGTMNDIDRSVETFDFAMRRRFAWLEISVEETQDDILKGLDEAEEAKKRLKSLNEAIEKIEGLNRCYHIGASYFGKLKNDDSNTNKEKFKNLWDYHLEPLLREYLRGLPDAKKKLETLENAYNNAKS